MLELLESSPIYKAYMTIIKRHGQLIDDSKQRHQAVLIQHHNRMPQSHFDCSQSSCQNTKLLGLYVTSFYFLF